MMPPLNPRTAADALNFKKIMINNITEVLKMRQACVRAPEYVGCYTLPYEVESDKQEIRFEGGLLKVSVPIKGLEQKIIYRPSA